ncbi:hypothetical protein F0Q34_15565 [Pseudoroseomonas oryzae]|uniref:Uncharacterized protein n=1 Tax=Teichococcus oryzae TaxID=1608942 RepID=A0A5B2TEE6_9PROT|nr:hypothetical protein F0Q34_15565 [Pseudoroseomonas oryzae]
MGPLLRLSIFLSRLVRNPPPRRVALVMLTALVLAVGLVVVERTIGWPEALRADKVPMRRLGS